MAARVTLMATSMAVTDVRIKPIGAPVPKTEAPGSKADVPIKETDGRVTLMATSMAVTDVRIKPIGVPVAKTEAPSSKADVPIKETDGRVTLMVTSMAVTDVRIKPIGAPVAKTEAPSSKADVPIKGTDGRSHRFEQRTRDAKSRMRRLRTSGSGRGPPELSAGGLLDRRAARVETAGIKLPPAQHDLHPPWPAIRLPPAAIRHKLRASFTASALPK